MARSANHNLDNDLYEDDFGRSSDSSNGNFSEQIDLQHALRTLRKYKWPIALFTAMVTALAAYYAHTATPIYSSTSTLLIEQQAQSSIPKLEELYGLDTSNSDYYQTQFELLKSRTLAIRVVEKLNLWNDPELSNNAALASSQQAAAHRDAIGIESESLGDQVVGFFTGLRDRKTPSTLIEPIEIEDSAVATTATTNESTSPSVNYGSDTDRTAGLTDDREFVVGRFMARLTVEPVRNTKLVKIRYESTRPEHAALIANSVGEQYIQSYLDSKLELTTIASSWLNERLGDLKVKLDESKDRLIGFQQTNGLVDLDGGIGALDQQELLLSTAELAQAESALNSKADVFREVNALRGNPELLDTVPSVQADPLVQRTKIEQGSAQRQLDELLNRYGARHPRVVDARSQLTTLNSALASHVNRVIGSIEKDYKFSQQRVASLKAKINAGKEKYQVLGSKKFELDALEREVATNQDLYDTFFNRISEANSADGLITANAVISDFAVPAKLPIKPKKSLIVALATLASLVLSMLCAFLYEQMDDTVKGTNDVEKKLGVKLLGILPLIKNGFLNRARPLPLNPSEIDDPKGTFVEAVNTMRTALCINDGDKPNKIIMVTSSVPSEGKSTCSINLAYSLAQLERVLLIDCDMRKPTIAKAANLDKNVPGLSSLITKSAQAQDCIHRGVFNGYVDVLPSGPIPQQPLELLSSKRFEKIVKQLGQHYDRIVIDSAPTQAVSDALVISKLCDAVVYAVKSHETSIDLVKRGLQRLGQVNASIAGIVVTQVNIDKITSYGGDYYYQGYYDYYDYSEKDSGKRGTGKLHLSPEEMVALRHDDSDFDLNLDLDNLANVNEFSMGNNDIDGVRSSTNEPHFNNQEFDLTMHIEAERPPKLAERSAIRTNIKTQKKSRFKDDLDML